MPPKALKAKDSMSDKELINRTWYQQGFSKEGAELLARPWINPEPPVDPTDFTLASFINSERGYAPLK